MKAKNIDCFGMYLFLKIVTIRQVATSRILVVAGHINYSKNRQPAASVLPIYFGNLKRANSSENARPVSLV